MALINKLECKINVYLISKYIKNKSANKIKAKMKYKINNKNSNINQLSKKMQIN